MVVGMLLAAAILVSISFLALKILSGVAVTPPTLVRELSDKPIESWSLRARR